MTALLPLFEGQETAADPTPERENSPCRADRHLVTVESTRRVHPLFAGAAVLEQHRALRHLSAEELERIRRELGADRVGQDCVTWGAAPPPRPQEEAPLAEEEVPF